VRYDLWADNVSTGQTQAIRNTAIVGTSWTSPTDIPIGTYRIWIRGVDAAGVPAGWSPLTELQIAAAPVPVAAPAATFDRTPTLQWQPVAGAVRYELQLRNRVTDVDAAFVTNLTTTSWTAPANLPAGSYQWWVMAVGASECRTNWSTGTDLTIGGTTRLLSPQGTGVSSTPTFSWQAVGDTARYELWVNRLDVAQNRVIFVTNLTQTSYEAPAPLVSGGQYRVWVRAVSITGEFGAWTAAVNFTVAATTVTPESSGNDDELIAHVLPELMEEWTSVSLRHRSVIADRDARDATPPVESTTTRTGATVHPAHRSEELLKPVAPATGGFRRSASLLAAALLSPWSKKKYSNVMENTDAQAVDVMIQTVVDELLHQSDAQDE
jgi:hypothetical protein